MRAFRQRTLVPLTRTLQPPSAVRDRPLPVKPASQPVGPPQPLRFPAAAKTSRRGERAPIERPRRLLPHLLALAQHLELIVHEGTLARRQRLRAVPARVGQVRVSIIITIGALVRVAPRRV